MLSVEPICVCFCFVLLLFCCCFFILYTCVLWIIKTDSIRFGWTSAANQPTVNCCNTSIKNLHNLPTERFPHPFKGLREISGWAFLFPRMSKRVVSQEWGIPNLNTSRCSDYRKGISHWQSFGDKSAMYKITSHLKKLVLSPPRAAKRVPNINCSPYIARIYLVLKYKKFYTVIYYGLSEVRLPRH